MFNRQGLGRGPADHLVDAVEEFYIQSLCAYVIFSCDALAAGPRNLGL